MTAVEVPQGFVVAEECRKAASQNGYRRDLGAAAGWARYGSTTAKGTIHLAAAGPAGPGSVAKSGYLVTCLRDLPRGVEA